MSEIAGSKCELCDAVLVLFSRQSEHIMVAVRCMVCDKTHDISIDDLTSESVVLHCCGQLLLPRYPTCDDDIVITVSCAGCGKPGAISLSETLDALNEEDEVFQFNGLVH